MRPERGSRAPFSCLRGGPAPPGTGPRRGQQHMAGLHLVHGDGLRASCWNFRPCSVRITRSWRPKTRCRVTPPRACSATRPRSGSRRRKATHIVHQLSEVLLLHVLEQEARHALIDPRGVPGHGSTRSPGRESARSPGTASVQDRSLPARGTRVTYQPSRRQQHPFSARSGRLSSRHKAMRPPRL